MYDLILSDPAWPYYGSVSKDAAAGKHYDLLSWEDLAAMPMRESLNKDGAVFMWATGPLLHKQVALFEEWGLHYRGVVFVWVKTRKDGGIISGQGVPPTFVKPTTEFLLGASTCKRGRPLKLLNSAAPQVVLSPRLRHSEKPVIFHELLEGLFPADIRRLELFARRERVGWDATGLELDGTDYRGGRIVPVASCHGENDA